MSTADIIRDTLMSWADSRYIDFIYVGNKGADFATKDKNKYLGSVTNEVLRHTKVNVVFFP